MLTPLACRSSLPQNGGGIYARGNATLRNVTVLNATAGFLGYGGGVYVSGAAEIEDLYVDGAALGDYGNGAGINVQGRANITRAYFANCRVGNYACARPWHSPRSSPSPLPLACQSLPTAASTYFVLQK